MKPKKMILTKKAGFDDTLQTLTAEHVGASYVSEEEAKTQYDADGNVARYIGIMIDNKGFAVEFKDSIAIYPFIYHPYLFYMERETATHEEIMTFWWSKSRSGLWRRVEVYNSCDERTNEPLYRLGTEWVEKAFFNDMTCSECPPLLDK